MSEIDPEVGEDNIRIEPAEEEAYEPTMALLHDNGVVIFDILEFQEEFDCYAAQFMDGILYVLDRETRLWRQVEPERKKASLKPV